MKQKIVEALKQGYKNLGLEDSAFERVAGLGETFITEEAQIENFVKGAEPLLKSIQSEADKLRTAQKRIAEFDKPAPNVDPEPPATPPATPQPQDFAKMIADAVALAVKPLSEELAGFKQKQTVDAAVAEAKAKFDSNKAVQSYKTEAENAWERVMELHEYNKDWTSDEINEKAMNFFNKYTSQNNRDMEEPFKGSNGSAGNKEVDVDEITRALQERGNLPKP